MASETEKRLQAALEKRAVLQLEISRLKEIIRAEKSILEPYISANTANDHVQPDQIKGWESLLDFGCSRLEVFILKNIEEKATILSKILKIKPSKILELKRRVVRNTWGHPFVISQYGDNGLRRWMYGRA
jgi:hypothetical protein